MSIDQMRHSARRHRTYSPDGNGLAGWKLGVVIAVLVLCFAMLYPSMFHPLLTSLLFRAPAPQKASPNRPPVHPAMGSPHPRPDMHPGLRMAAGQAEVSSQTSSKGMFAWMLPIYTAGVIAFLIYTLVKSKKKRRRRRSYSSTESDSDETSHCTDERGFEKLSKKKVHSLQERLRQTESAMQKILEQLNTIAAESVETASKTKKVEIEQSETSNKESNTERYLHDLEQALRDFKHLSKNYNKYDQRSEDDDADNDSFEDDGGVENATDGSIENDQNLDENDMHQRESESRVE